MRLPSLAGHSLGNLSLRGKESSLLNECGYPYSKVGVNMLWETEAKD